MDPVIPYHTYTSTKFLVEDIKAFVQVYIGDSITENDIDEIQRETITEGLQHVSYVLTACFEILHSYIRIWLGRNGNVRDRLDLETSQNLSERLRNLSTCVDTIKVEDFMKNMNTFISMIDDLDAVFEIGLSIYSGKEKGLEDDAAANKLKEEEVVRNLDQEEPDKKLDDVEHLKLKMETYKDEVVKLNDKVRNMVTLHTLDQEDLGKSLAEVERCKLKLENLELVKKTFRDEVVKLNKKVRNLVNLHKVDHKKLSDVQLLKEKAENLEVIESQQKGKISGLELQLQQLLHRNSLLEMRLDLPSNDVLNDNIGMQARIEDLESQLEQQKKFLTREIVPNPDAVEVITQKYKGIISNIVTVNEAKEKLRDEDTILKGKECLSMQHQILDLKAEKFELERTNNYLEAKTRDLESLVKDLLEA